MDVILLERIRKLGQMGDVVTVKDGYARNFLLPTKKALRANKTNLEHFETQRAELEVRNLEQKSEAEAVVGKIEGQSFISIRQAGDTGQLYGSVSSRDVAEMITEGGIQISRNQILLNRPIKTLGLHPILLSLHPEVETQVMINIARTPEEAERQAKGEDVTIEREDDLADTDMEADIKAEDIFDEEALAASPEGETAVSGADESDSDDNNESE